MVLLFSSTTFVDKIIRGSIIYNVLYQLVIDIRKYLSKKRKGPQKQQVPYRKGKVFENKECLTALVIFTVLCLLRQIFLHINHKLMKLTLYPCSVKGRVNASANCFDPSQAAQSGQTVTGINLLLLVNFLHAQGLVYFTIQFSS